MKEIRKIVEAYSSIDLSNKKAALVTVVDVQGSSYRRRGARMLVLDDGIYLGGISGGCLEGDALKRAQIAILKDKPSVLRYDTTEGDDNQIGAGLGCNGIIDVLFTPLHISDPINPVTVLTSLLQTRTPEILLTIIKINDQISGNTIHFNNGNLKLNLPDSLAAKILPDIFNCQKSLESKFVTHTSAGQSVSLFIEVVLPETRLVLVGSNNDILPITRIAKEIGWEIFLITQLSKMSKPLFETTDKIIDIKSGEVPELDNYTAIVLMSHDYKTDLQFLPKFLSSAVKYIGLLGPRKRAEKLFNDLQLDYNTADGWNNVYGPAGLDIGASTPEEIGLSIIAEIRATFANKNSGSLKFKTGTIYDH